MWDIYEVHAMKKVTSRSLAYAGVLIAMNVLLTRFVSIPVGQVLRFTAGAVPVILSGLMLGPLTGALTGAVGDLIGCAVSGYAPNPLITLSSALYGVIPALFVSVINRSRAGMKRFMVFLGVIFVTMIITSQGLHVLGLSLLYGMPAKAVFITRIPQTLFLLAINTFLTDIIYSRVILPSVGYTGKTTESGKKVNEDNADHI